MSETPAALGYRMPAEWEPHAATWLAWPHNTVTWPDQLAQVQDIFLHMILLYTSTKPSICLCTIQRQQRRCESTCTALG